MASIVKVKIRRYSRYSRSKLKNLNLPFDSASGTLELLMVFGVQRLHYSPNLAWLESFEGCGTWGVEATGGIWWDVTV